MINEVLDDTYRNGRRLAERIETGALRLPVAERIALIERLVVAHESFDGIFASWVPELQRRIDEMWARRVHPDGNGAGEHAREDRECL